MSGAGRARAPARRRLVTGIAAALVALATSLPIPSALAVFSKQATVTGNTLGAAATFPGCYRDAVATDAPASYWRLDETSGTTAADSKGSNPGTYRNGVRLGQAGALPDVLSNKAASFDGVDDDVQVGDVYGFAGTASFSVEFWLNPTSTNSSLWRPVMAKEDPGADWSSRQGWAIWLVPDTNMISIERWNGTTQFRLDSLTPMLAGTWYHVVATYDGSTAAVYVNGRLDVSAASSLPMNAHSVPLRFASFGAASDTWLGRYAGLLDDVAIYSTTLSATQVRTHYNTGRCYKDAVLADSAVGYWRLGETSGTTAADGMGGRHGTYTNGPSLNQTGALSGDGNPSASFDGVDDRVAVPAEPALNPAAQFTIEAWARPTGGAGTIRAVASSFYDSSNGTVQGYFLGADNTNTWIMYLGTGTAYAWVTGQSVAMNTWSHVVGTFDGTTARLYVNGLLVDSKPVTYSPNTLRPFAIGAWQSTSSWSDQFTGQIDEVTLYNSALSQTRIQAHYLIGRSYKDTALDSGPVAYWRLGEASGSSAADSKGTYAGTYTNSPGLAQPGALAADADTAARFNGSSSYVDVPYAAALNPAQFTVEAWARWGGGGSGAWRSVAGTWNDSTGGGYWLGISTGGYWYVSTQGSGGSYSEAFGPTATSGSWVHLAATDDGTALRLYVNGIEVVNTPSPNYVPQTSFPVYIGANRYPGGPGDYFDGVIDDVAVYNRALPAAEIKLHYDSGRQ